MSRSAVPVATFESPWFWLALFLSAAIFSLSLAAPRFGGRQPQIERQYHARERSGYAPPAAHAGHEVASDDRLMIPLRPLQLLLGAILLACTAAFWIQRVRQGTKPPSDPAPDPPDTSP